MNTTLLKVLLKGIATYIPGLYRLRWQRPDSRFLARYGYSVWLRHLTMAWKHGYKRIPGCVAELGPGMSLGTGLAALLSGAETYYALDVLEYADPARDPEVLDELADLFRRRAPIPDQAEFPRVEPTLEAYEFPHAILTEAVLGRALAEERIQSIRGELAGARRSGPGDRRVTYFVPWHDPGVVKRESVDMVFSQAVMQYVDDLEGTYDAMQLWLKPGGLMSHQIAFHCHGAARTWNGHWTYSDLVWKLIRGKRPSFITRLPCSAHLECLAKFGFQVIGEVRMTRPSDLARRRLAARFADLSDEDLRTAGLFVQAIKGPAEVGPADAGGRGIGRSPQGV